MANHFLNDVLAIFGDKIGFQREDEKTPAVISLDIPTEKASTMLPS